MMEESSDSNEMKSLTSGSDPVEDLESSKFQHMDGLGIKLEAVCLEQEEEDTDDKMLGFGPLKSENSFAFDLCTNTNQSIKTGEISSSQPLNQNSNLGGTVTLINSENDESAKKGGRNKKRVKFNPPLSTTEVNKDKDLNQERDASTVAKSVGKGFSSESPGNAKPAKTSHVLQLSTTELTQDETETGKPILPEVDKDKRVASLFMCNGKTTMTESRCGEMDKLPIELAHGETLVSLDGIDDIESIGGCSQENNDKGEIKEQNLEEVTTATGEVIKLKKPRTEESGNKSQEIGMPVVETSPLHIDDGSFPCGLCTQRFSRKLYLNNHMEEQHGVKYVFTERGRKVKLVRIPKNYDPQNMDDLDPSIRKLIKKSAGCQDLSKVVGVVTEPDPDTDEANSPAAESSADNKSKQSEKEPEEGVECGFLVDKINTVPYQKALSRGEVPFCAFSPISTEDFYLLKIQDVSDSSRHMLIPASKDDVFNTAGAVKTTDDQEPGNDDAMNYKVAIVAIARQQYSEQEKQLMVSVDPPLKKDKDKIACVRFLTLDKFADFAFLGFDGNVSEFAKNAEPDGTANTTAATGSDNTTVLVPPKLPTPPVPSPTKEKTPPRAPARRGRGGRRRVSRKPFSMPSPPRPQQQRTKPPPQFTTVPSALTGSQMLPPITNLQFPFDMANDINQTFVKMEQADQLSETQFFTQMAFPQAPNPTAYTQEQPATAPLPVEFAVPMPISEVTVGTGTGHNDENINHDIITIALDQLFVMTSTDGSNANKQRGTTSERGGRGGRRPGRKPGRKPTKDRDPIQNENHENSFNGPGTGMHMPRQDGEMPKRRGRPPKNRVLMPISDQDFESVSADTIDTEEFDSLLLVDKRMKFFNE